MSDSDIKRVHDDLNVIRQAIGNDLPFGKADAQLSLIIAACGAVIGGWALWAPHQYLRGVIVPVAFIVIAYALLGRRVGTLKGHQPERWREFRRSILALAVIMPFAIAYLFWEKSLDLPREFVGAAAVFFISLGVLFVGIVDPARRHYVGSALPGMIFGAAIPLLSSRYVVLGAGLCLSAAGLLTAVIQFWILRKMRPSRAAD